LNTYGYVDANPVIGYDPKGLFDEGKGGGSGGGGTKCRLVGSLVLGVYQVVGGPMAVMLCMYNCATSCPPQEGDILMKIVMRWNPPFFCEPTYRRRLGE